MFRREPYARLEPILAAVDGAVLEAHGFALGGATRIALAHGEVRISLDLDFLGSNAAGFAALRALVRDEGVASILRPRMARTRIEPGSAPRRRTESTHAQTS